MCGQFLYRFASETGGTPKGVPIPLECATFRCADRPYVILYPFSLTLSSYMVDMSGVLGDISRVTKALPLYLLLGRVVTDEVMPFSFVVSTLSKEMVLAAATDHERRVWIEQLRYAGGLQYYKHVKIPVWWGWCIQRQAWCIQRPTCAMPLSIKGLT